MIDDPKIMIEREANLIQNIAPVVRNRHSSSLLLESFLEGFHFDEKIHCFNHKKTILNTLHSAIYQCYKFFNSLKNHEHFVDEEFGPQKGVNENSTHAFSIYWEGIEPKEKGYLKRKLS